MTRILVTGGSGKAGRAVVRDLIDHGYEVLSADTAPDPQGICPCKRADLTDPGQAFELLAQADGVVHLAALLGNRTEQEVFRVNTLSTYNVFHAATTLGMERVVWASSETVLGLPFDVVKPAVVPIDETHAPYPGSSYSLSKVVGEQMADQFARWSGTAFVGLRFSNIMEPSEYADRFPTWQDDPWRRKWNLWGYVDARDAAQSCRLGLEAQTTGARSYIIAAADTVMRRPNAELLAEVFPHAKLNPGTGEHETLLSIDKAKRELGYRPAYGWRAS